MERETETHAQKKMKQNEKEREESKESGEKERKKRTETEGERKKKKKKKTKKQLNLWDTRPLGNLHVLAPPKIPTSSCDAEPVRKFRCVQGDFCRRVLLLHHLLQR